ncbi:hypothetical protein [Microbacterium sp. GCS4]|uniref:hypothetical protein n=1 Tax=Microbacterium sp. GCS4 TaxID=1692239 RepID=UPI000682AF08|nr:hypothetical protein [Microbacterium sp. GCS4]KNY05208.1 hypothetical protein AKH00_12570 [Microbacterium sp. GCS4]
MTATAITPSFATALRRLYFVRAAFAVVWAVALIATAPLGGALLTALLVIYPLFDAGAVLWQMRAAGEARRARTSQWAGVVVSVLVALALGIASSLSVPAALAIWGVWAIGAGIPQLITAIRNRRTGGQVPQMLSGGISVFAGTAFLIQGLMGATAIAGVGGYAIVGAVFFLISAIRLGILAKKRA